MTINYQPGRMPTVNTDCATCDGTGIGQFGDPNTSRCSYCAGRGFFSHTVDLYCDCEGCVEFRSCGEEALADEI